MIATASRNRNADASVDQATILVVDDHASARTSMADVLTHAGHQVDCCASAHEALTLLRGNSYDVVLTDLNMPGMTGLEFMQTLSNDNCESQIIMITAHASIHTAVEAMRFGAFDYIEKPLNSEELETVVTRALNAAQSPTSLPSGRPVGDGVAMIGSSVAMTELRRRIAQVAPTPETVLITGENGTGKELIARSVHNASQRSQRKLVSLNCPVLSAQLMESELFGHQRGSFTGADARRVGRFELADGGTILLDEITEIDLSLQAKLLRVLQERSFERVGESQSIQVDVRVLATTNRQLREEVEAGRFREDLYFRLAVVELQAPPLRDRREDIPELIAHFQDAASKRLNGDAPVFNADAIELLTAYHWPGNVRELENIVTRAGVFAEGQTIGADDVQPWLIGMSGENHESTESQTLGVGSSLEQMERRLIEATLERFDGHRQKTAEALGIGVRTLSGKLRSYGLAPRAKTFAKAS